MGLQAPEFARITVPALGLFAIPGSPAALMQGWYDQDDSQVRAAVEEMYAHERRGKEQAIQRFDAEIPNSQAIGLENADHWIFVSHEQEVLAAIEAFVDGL
jgi:hypothetical protein